MSFCTNCGAQLGVGRFCTNCGEPIPARGPAAPDSAGPGEMDATQVRLPRVQPDAAAGPRFPLYAAPPETPYPTAPPPPAQRRRRSPWPWLLALVLLLGVGGGAWALTRDDGSEDAAGSEPSAQGSPSNTASAPEHPEESTSSDTTEQPDGRSDGQPGGEPVDLGPEASVSAPPPTKPGQSVDGGTVRYPATNMLDGDPATAYRIDGDATGTTITFSFDKPVTIREIGLVNGYAKVDGKGAARRDWYASNRKVLRVEWGFDDGTTAEQDLRTTTDLQTMQVAATTTQTVTLRLLRVSKPGPDPRNTTAISTVLLRGQR